MKSCDQGLHFDYLQIRPLNKLWGRYDPKTENMTSFLFVTITSDLKDDRDIKRQVRPIYCRGNMIIQKFSECSVDVKNQLFRSYVSCLYCCALWKDYSTSSFNMVKVAYNNVYRALMLIKRVYGHSISSEYVNNCIDGFEATVKEN